MLTSRLGRFLEAGLMHTRPHSEENSQREYVLTPKGLDLQPVVIALTTWGDRWAASAGPPVVYEHQGCGGQIHQRLQCQACDAPPAPPHVQTRPGPGAR